MESEKSKRGRPRISNDYLIRSIRKAMGLSRDRIAEITGLGISTIHRAEKGGVISAEVAYKIANAMNISPDIVLYCCGQIPAEIMDAIKKDPLSFKEMVDEWNHEPWKHTRTKEYMTSLNNKIQELMSKEKVNPEINKILSKISPTD